MTEFITEDFLLKTKAARRLYHEYAEGLPIVDYHCHLEAGDLAQDRPFDNIARAWVLNDPYKHRAMRIAGVPEKLITGAATDREKFDAWAATVPQTLGNPLFHWTALELKRFFDVAELLAPDSAERIWGVCNRRLAAADSTARQMLVRARVECLCTSDRLLDDLQAHRSLAQSGFAPRVLPSWRGDDILGVELADYPQWLEWLGNLAGHPISSFDTFQQAIAQRLDCFAQRGCRLSDHGLDDFVYLSVRPDETALLFERRLAGVILAPVEIVRLKSGLYQLLGLAYARRNWGMQLHIGAQRQTSTRLRRLTGSAGGYAAIGQGAYIPSLCHFLDDLERAGGLPRIVLYPLNPADNAAVAALTGAFAQDGVRGKIQFGPAWWYNDHALGIRNQLEAVANYGLLPAFIGMTTDSRSPLSMTRHEYFRRVLCDFLGDQVEAGLFPSDDKLLGQCIRAIACDNARQWLFPDPTPKL